MRYVKCPNCYMHALVDDNVTDDEAIAEHNLEFHIDPVIWDPAVFVRFEREQE